MFQVNHVELSPNYGGTLMGISNTFGNIPQIVAPSLAGTLTKGNVSRHEVEINPLRYLTF